jgi:hypothetical protein
MYKARLVKSEFVQEHFIIVIELGCIKKNNPGQKYNHLTFPYIWFHFVAPRTIDKNKFDNIWKISTYPFPQKNAPSYCHIVQNKMSLCVFFLYILNGTSAQIPIFIFV